MDDTVFDSGESAIEVLILQLLQNAADTNHLLLALNRKEAISLPSVKLIVAHQREKASFPTSFLNWITHQCQPFFAYTLDLNDSEDSQIGIDAAPSDNNDLVSNGSAASTACPVIQSAVNSTAKLPSKPKKRMTLNSVPSAFGSALSGNIASTPNSADMIGIGTGKESKTSLWADRENSMSTNIEQPVQLKPKLAFLDTPEKSGNFEANRGTGAKDPNSNGFVQAMSFSKASVSEKRNALYSVHVDTAVISPSSATEPVIRMSAIFTALIYNQQILFSDVMPLLAKLCSLSLPGPNEKKQIFVTVADNEKFPTLLLSSDLFHSFVIETMEKFLPVLKLLGDKVTSGFAESPLLSRYMTDGCKTTKSGTNLR